MAAVLTSKQLTQLAKTGWKFDLGIRDARTFNDSVVYTGTGIRDLDRLIDRINSMPNIPNYYQLTVDVGSLFSSYVKVSVDDVVALRATFTSIYGSVDKPGFPFDVALTEETKEIMPFVTNGTIEPGEFNELTGGNPGLATP